MYSQCRANWLRFAVRDRNMSIRKYAIAAPAIGSFLFALLVEQRSQRSQTMNRVSLELAQELRETKDSLAQHKRDPFLWLVILGPLALAAITFWGPVLFPASDAIRAIRQVLPKADVILQHQKNLPSCRARKYVFGYDLRRRQNLSPTKAAPEKGLG